MTILINEFHNTEISIRAAVGEHVADSTVRKIRKKLCGISDCYCSGYTGIRGGEFGLIPTSWDRTAPHVVVDKSGM